MVIHPEDILMTRVVLNSIPGKSNNHTLTKCTSSQLDDALSEGLFPDAESRSPISISWCSLGNLTPEKATLDVHYCYMLLFSGVMNHQISNKPL